MWAIATALVFAVFRRAEGSLRAGPNDDADAVPGGQFRGTPYSHLESVVKLHDGVELTRLEDGKDGKDGKGGMDSTMSRRQNQTNLLYGSMYSNVYDASELYYHVPQDEPDCTNCVAAEPEGDGSDDQQCCTVAPSEKTMCSRFLPDSIIAYINDSSITSTWRDWDKTGYVECPSYNQWNQQNGDASGTAKCDPCKRGTAFDEDAKLYCEYIDGQQICYEATPWDYQIECSPESATNWYGGWNIKKLSKDDFQHLKCTGGSSHCEGQEDCTDGQHCNKHDLTLKNGACKHCNTDDKVKCSNSTGGDANSATGFCTATNSASATEKKGKAMCQKCGYCPSDSDSSNP